MALLRNANPKNASGGYERLFGNPELGTLVSKIQSGVISSGNELERTIASLVQNVPNLDEFIRHKKMPRGIFLAHKKQIKKSKSLSLSGAEPDFMIFKRYNKNQVCHVVELKDGHVFDTKKAEAERQNMQNFISRNVNSISYRISAHFCAFNQDNREKIQEGFKNRISLKEAMTGREFCELLEIDYDEIVEARREHEKQNVEYFLSELIKMDVVRRRLLELLNS